MKGRLIPVLQPEGKELMKLSGQGYGAVLVPSATAISRAALERTFRDAAAAPSLAGGGKLEEWDAMTGGVRPVSGASAAGGAVRAPLDLPPHATRILVTHR